MRVTAIAIAMGAFVSAPAAVATLVEYIARFQ